jgi:hypothetical protein
MVNELKVVLWSRSSKRNFTLGHFLPMDPACKTPVNLVTSSIKNMACRKTLESWKHTAQYPYKYALRVTCVYLALFADDICIYARDVREGYVVRNLHRNLNSVKA